MEDNSFLVNLPTATLFLDKDFNIINKIRPVVEREYDEYYLATCHYVVRNDEPQYYLGKDKIKSLLLMKKDDGYPHYVAKTWKYGV